MNKAGSPAVFALLVLVPAIGAPSTSVAAEYPEKALTAIVPFAAGSSTDTMTRRISPLLSKALGQQIIIENKPGADGRIGIEALTKAASDGYAILFSGQAVALAPALRRNVPWDPRQIQPVAELGQSPYVIAVNATVPAKSLMEFLNLVKKNPDKLNGSAGGNSTEMSIALFRIKTGTRVTTVPYKGTGLAATAVGSGEVDFAIMDASAWTAFLSSGRVRALAVAGERRLSSLPNVPTAAEAGLPDFTVGTMFGVYTKAGSPSGAVQRLNVEINRIIVSPEVVKGLNQLGLEPIPKSVEAFTQQYVNDLAKWKDLVKRANIPMTD